VIDFGKAIAWPSSDARYCTSDHKRAEVKKLLTRLAAEHREKKGKGAKPKILNALGIRAQESSSRAAMDNFDREEDTGTKTVDRWYPIHRWPEEKVWTTIAKSGVPYHKAYSLGMRRLSCVFCVFASKEDLMVAATHNPHLFRTYLDLEEKVGSSFKPTESLADVAAEIKKRRDAGFELNELAEWVKKSLGLDDSADALVKAELGKPDPDVALLVLEAALQRLTKHGEQVTTVAIEWKVGGACVHLETEADSHHALLLPYPEAYNASLAVALFAREHDLALEEHNAPPPLPTERTEELTKSTATPMTPRFVMRTWPGQVPSRDNLEVLRQAQQPPPKWTPARMMAHDGAYLSPANVVQGIGLDRAKENEWTGLLKKASSHANELTFRQDIMGKMLTDKLDPSTRQALFQRAMSFYRDMRKSLVDVTTPDELRKSEPELPRADRLYKAIERRVRQAPLGLPLAKLDDLVRRYGRRSVAETLEKACRAGLRYRNGVLQSITPR
jgi:3'-phosphoadenosine 5'-phosphosulfate sulfotransferase (PAPS reductase)/FAD synthetase